MGIGSLRKNRLYMHCNDLDWPGARQSRSPRRPGRGGDQGVRGPRPAAGRAARARSAREPVRLGAAHLPLPPPADPRVRAGPRVRRRDRGDRRGSDTDYAGQQIAVGDRITAAYFITCHRCEACLLGDVHLCEHAYDYWSRSADTPPHFHGTFATHYLVHRDQYFYKVPDDGRRRRRCRRELRSLTGAVRARRGGSARGPEPRDPGCGGLGLYAAAVARETGANVVMVEGSPERIALATRFGVDHVVDMRRHRRRMTASHGCASTRVRAAPTS